VTLLSDSQNYVEEEGGSTRLECAFRCSSYTLFDFPVIWSDFRAVTVARPPGREVTTSRLGLSKRRNCGPGLDLRRIPTTPTPE